MSKVGKEIVLDGIHLGKVIAEQAGFYLVLLNKEGKGYLDFFNEGKGWALNITDSEELKKLCGKYGNDPENRFWFFNDRRSYQFFEKINKLLANE